MEPLTIFAAAVALIGACSISFSIAKFFGKGIYSEGRHPSQRDDWFCFFKPADLYGHKGAPSSPVHDPQQDEMQRRREQQRRRPRA